MTSQRRISTGVAGLDEHLGGGLLPGTLTAVVGATGIGKTQLGLQFLDAGRRQDVRGGIVFDMTARVDSQSHADYTRRMFGWEPLAHPQGSFSAPQCFDVARPCGDYLHVFDQAGRRVTRRELDFDHWHDWQAELAAKLATTIDFFHSNFVRGTRRVLIDGIEPVANPGESIQYELFEYVYHQILRKESAWVARDLFRQDYRAYAEAIDAHAYDCREIAAVMLITSHESMLDTLVEKPLVDGDLLATANTLIYMGKLRDGDKLARGMYVAKHRGSACTDSIVRYRIDDRGLQIN